MIRSCKDSDTQKLVDRKFCKTFSGIEKQARMRLDRLNAATSLEDLGAIPGHHLEKLVGDREGQYRICFEWKDSDAYKVEVADYH